MVEQLLNEVTKIVHEVLGDNQISIKDNLYQFGMNSLSFINIIVDIEKKYNICFPAESLDGEICNTIYDICLIIEAQIKQV